MVVVRPQRSPATSSGSRAGRFRKQRPSVSGASTRCNWGSVLGRSSGYDPYTDLPGTLPGAKISGNQSVAFRLGRVAPISFEQTYTLASPIDTHRTEVCSQVRRCCLEKRPTENCRRQQIEVVQQVRMALAA